LYRPGDSVVHRLAPEVKVLAAVGFVTSVVATPREAFLAFACYPVLLVVVWAAAGIPLGWPAARAVIEVPFVLLAVALPLVSSGPRVDVLGVALSEPGLLAGWNILVKGTLGVLTSLTLAATTSWRDLLVGLARLRVPPVVVTIAMLMTRYLGLLVAEAHRMRLARIARGHDPRFLWQVAATTRGVGSLFVRGYERGERVHLAMLSRGWTGRMPKSLSAGPENRHWWLGLSPTVAALAVCVGGWLS
jgi:cobalt/nickel transport system permease protein